VTEYSIIGEPPLSGGVQDIVTVPALKLVVGAEGTFGFYAARIVTVFDMALNP
jgi:hypothetical protein